MYYVQNIIHSFVSIEDFKIDLPWLLLFSIELASINVENRV